MGKAHVICCNDYPEAVFIGSEGNAEKKKEKLAKAHWNKNKLNWSNIDYKEYRNRYYWHIHTVDCFKA